MVTFVTWLISKTSSELENSVLEINHATNVTTVLDETADSDRVSRYHHVPHNYEKLYSFQYTGMPIFAIFVFCQSFFLSLNTFRLMFHVFLYSITLISHILTSLYAHKSTFVILHLHSDHVLAYIIMS